MNLKMHVRGLIGVAGFAMAGFASPSFALSPTKLPAGQFDSYVLAMSYQNDFCASHPDKPECQDGPAVSGFTLHGLWPNRNDDPQHNYQYCGSVAAQAFPYVKTGGNWCAPQFDVRAKLPATLSKVMPGVASCLYNHEWYAHGSCSGQDVNPYFTQAATLASRFLGLQNINSLIQNAAGGSVNRNDILNALNQDLGSNASRSVTLLCRKDGDGYSYLSEIDLSLSRSNLMKFPAASSLVPLPKIGGTCPSTGIYITQ